MVLAAGVKAVVRSVGASPQQRFAVSNLLSNSEKLHLLYICFTSLNKLEFVWPKNLFQILAKLPINRCNTASSLQCAQMSPVCCLHNENVQLRALDSFPVQASPIYSYQRGIYFTIKPTNHQYSAPCSYTSYIRDKPLFG